MEDPIVIDREQLFLLSCCCNRSCAVPLQVLKIPRLLGASKWVGIPGRGNSLVPWRPIRKAVLSRWRLVVYGWVTSILAAGHIDENAIQLDICFAGLEIQGHHANGQMSWTSID